MSNAILQSRIDLIRHRDNYNRSRCKRIEELKEVKEHFYKTFAETGKIDELDLMEMILNVLSLQECRQQDYGR